MRWRTILIGKWSWKRPFIFVATVYACLFVIVVFFAEKLIFFPPRPGFDDASRVVRFRSATGDSIAALDLPAKPGFPVLLYTHGNAEDLDGVLDLADEWQRLGFGVLAYDFPGYGLSTGTPTERTCEAAIQAAWDHLTKTKDIAPQRIVVMGRSVGSGPSVWLAERETPAGLILISPFTSTFAVRIPFPLFPRDRFPNLKRIPNVKCPLLVIHGANDEIIASSHGHKLFDAATVADKQIVDVPDVGHNDIDLLAEEVVKPMGEFAERVSK